MTDTHPELPPRPNTNVKTPSRKTSKKPEPPEVAAFRERASTEIASSGRDRIDGTLAKIVGEQCWIKLPDAEKVALLVKAMRDVEGGRGEPLRILKHLRKGKEWKPKTLSLAAAVVKEILRDLTDRPDEARQLIGQFLKLIPPLKPEVDTNPYATALHPLHSVVFQIFPNAEWRSCDLQGEPDWLLVRRIMANVPKESKDFPHPDRFFGFTEIPEAPPRSTPNPSPKGPTRPQKLPSQEPQASAKGKTSDDLGVPKSGAIAKELQAKIDQLKREVERERQRTNDSEWKLTKANEDFTRLRTANEHLLLANEALEAKVAEESAWRVRAEKAESDLVSASGEVQRLKVANDELKENEFDRGRTAERREMAKYVLSQLAQLESLTPRVDETVRQMLLGACENIRDSLMEHDRG